uniref:Tetratricopeptide repeat protein n=1 Tax=uncultured marine group II euryarchaeote 37F11 TaxID=133822 RepID=Q9P9D6_9ARCH|nr:unknown [uncultured marine group II euryarchaeote 37F11]
MNECAVCGILYLAGPSCPACGSQLRAQDQSFSDSDAALPTEVPGLDDAAQAWYDLEGIEAPVEQEEEAASSLPFGFGGESQTNISRLPFGIGSHPEGIPFELSNQDSGQEEEEVVQHVEPVIESTNLEPVVALETEQHDSPVVSASVEIEPVLAPVEAPDLPLIEEPPVQVPVPGPIRLTAIPFVEPTVDTSDLPNEWSIESFGGSDQIFTAEEDVIEVVFSDLEDTVVHVEHDGENYPQMEKDSVYSEKSLQPFDLHPAQALMVDVGTDSASRALLESGFTSIGQGDWRSAARSFQQIVARFPQDSGAMNNYGIALLQVASVMQHSNDPIEVSNSATQFEAAILSLREAVRTNSSQPESIYNLSQALLLSGREEKALALLDMAGNESQRESNFTNLRAAILAQLGRYDEAKRLLVPLQADKLASGNLLKLPAL